MSALQALLEEDMKRENWQTYVASVAWAIGRVHMGRDYMPPYTDIIKQHKPDNRTGEEIVDDLAAKLRRRAKDRGEIK